MEIKGISGIGSRDGPKTSCNNFKLPLTNKDEASYTYSKTRSAVHAARGSVGFVLHADAGVIDHLFRDEEYFGVHISL